MSEDYKEKQNTAAAGGPEDFLDQDKFAALLKRFDEEKLQDLLGKAGVSEVEEEETPDDFLDQERFAALLKRFDEEKLQDLLGKAGVADIAEEVPAEEPAKTENPPQPVKTEASPEPEKVEEPAEPVKAEDPAKEEAAAEPIKAEGPAEKEKAPRKKFRPSKRLLLIAVLAGLILVPVALNQIAMNVTLNSDDPIQYSEHVDEVSASKGSLIVNDVTVEVPTDGSEEYSISYAWAEDDEEYPSVPHAITAVYKDKDGNSTHSISLYRSETVPAAELESGKTVSSWFDDWKTVSEGKVKQEPLKTGKINGFYIYPEEASSDYGNYSYYFAVQEEDGISTYVIEGILLEDGKDVDLKAIMDACIKSIRIKKPDTAQA